MLLATQSIFQIAHSQSLLEIFWKDCTQISPFKQFIAHSLEQGFLYIGLRKNDNFEREMSFENDERIVVLIVSLCVIP